MANEPITTPADIAAPGAANPPVTDTATTEPTVTFQDLLMGIPPVVRGFVLLPDFTDRHNRIGAREKLSDKELAALLELSLETFCGLLKPSDYFDRAYEALGWTTDQQPRLKKIVADIIGMVMLPARQYFDDLTPVLKSLGADPTQYPSIELPTRTVTYDQAMAEVLSLINTDGEKYNLAQQDRIKTIMRMQMNGLDREEAMARYMRGEKVGGAGLSTDDATLVTLLVAQQMLYTKFTEPEPEIDDTAQYYTEPDSELLPSQLSGAAGEGATPSAPATTFTDEQIRNIYNGPPEERQRINEVMQKLSAMPNGKEKAVAVAFAGHNVERDPYDILSAMYYLAQDGSLLTVAKTDPRYIASVVFMLKRTAKPVEAMDVIKDPENPRYVTAYIAYQLEKGAAFSRADAARFALRIASLLKKKGWNAPDIAAFDPKAGEFRFTQEV